MNKIILLACLMAGLMVQVLTAFSQDPAYPAAPPPLQQVVRAEYFVDTDPGFGNGISIPLTPGVNLVNLNFVVNTAGLSNGAHRLFVRGLNNEGRWGLVAAHEFLYDFDPAYTTPASPQNLTQVEYFVDTDPGIGNGIAVSLTPSVNLSNLPFVVNTASLSIGGHRLYVRSRGNEGRWSITATREFLMDSDPAYPTPPPAPQPITQAEYFVNTDPGIGNGTAIALTAATDISNLPVTVNTASLPAASTNQLYVRSRSGEGHWSVTAVRSFVVNPVSEPSYPTPPAAPGNITYAEYFIDTDPGFGNASSISLTPGLDIANLSFNVNTAGLSNGPHTLFVRSFDDWGLTAYTTFNVGTALPLRFLSFALMNRPQFVELKWETADEVNTSHFMVERSADASNWTTIGQVASRNAAGRHVYTTKDSLPLNGWNYYRLKQVDIDGRFSYSRTLSVNRRLDKITLYPNPATTEVQLSLTKQPEVLRIDLIDAGGKLQQQFVFKQPGSLVTLPLNGVPAGVYLLRIHNGTEVWTERLMKK